MSLLFQYCPKLAVFDRLGTSVLLCRRKGEEDYDGVFSLIGGKMEHSDDGILEALRREKSEEVGEEFRVRILPYYSVDTCFNKKDGSKMILPHFYAEHIAGEIILNQEYSDFTWVNLASLRGFEPKISNISWIAPLLQRLNALAATDEFVEI